MCTYESGSGSIGWHAETLLSGDMCTHRKIECSQGKTTSLCQANAFLDSKRVINPGPLKGHSGLSVAYSLLEYRLLLSAKA